MKLIVGLGNPGDQYKNTRHNAGFMFIDGFAELHDFPEFKVKWDALTSEKGSGDDKWVLLKPHTFMNLSGKAVQKFAQFYKVGISDIFVIYDDVDLELGTVRFREDGSAGTHNGMKSVIDHLGTSDFPRLRLGIESRGESAPEMMDLTSFVLSPFNDEERAVFKNSIDDGIKVLEKALA